ncbi:uncharacterized protein LY89DRAFT_579513 [Mollisia scopiformis]|uniref:Uncharacterized protein n=1 Tax=Mollisia scopiformis TaxID=149040 RepID=A0A194XK61_MOLSC|nr:uncharacterized protein LY89DRAFT_579513 [Mollisia scopiformis]KUJ20548.1 hypothetical protein LY89DRAFT_579513 [Mollisia scopiformis]
MAYDLPFENYDDAGVYQRSTNRGLLQETRNFVVEFGRSQAQIAFDVEAEHVQSLLDTPAPAERPVRWINLWGPHTQTDIVELLGEHYSFSYRLLAIMKTEPPGARLKVQHKHARTFRARFYRKPDVETAKLSHGVPLEKAEPPRIQSVDGISHYALAEQMTNYHSIDVGSRFICVGANFMHEIASKCERSEIEIISEGVQKRLWSWLVLCDDHTVLSFHEHPGKVHDARDPKSFRANTLSVLSQLSNYGHGQVDPISMQTVRQALNEDLSHSNPGVEGASLLFYYLFDDWQAVYTTVAKYSKRLAQFDDAILFDMWKKSYQTPDVEIIPRLHRLGRQGRQLSHLYSGYKNLVQRILDSKAITIHVAHSTSSGDLASMKGHKGVLLAQSASQRFERLSDRLELLVIEQMKESLAERDALVTTYFNITAQKDSESTARLTRAATLLAKLSVLFLPVSLMTSYFSIQVSDLQGVYTVKDYWYAFAGIMSGSFVALFFFSRLLMWISENLDARLKQASHSARMYLADRIRKKRERDE